MKTKQAKPLLQCPCDDPKSEAWQRYYCRKKGCKKKAQQRQRPEDTTRTKAEKKKARNDRYRAKLRAEQLLEVCTVTTAASRGTPDKPSATTAKKPTKATPVQKKKSNFLRKFDALYKKNPLVFTYLKDPEE